MEDITAQITVESANKKVTIQLVRDFAEGFEEFCRTHEIDPADLVEEALVRYMLSYEFDQKLV